jgi:ABC-type nitrate/sulfonate/bicarbonate transport system ATPase subunit
VTPIVEVTGLSHGFGEVHVLNDISFEVPDGALVALVGPTGCGKSTLLRILAGLDQPGSGTARIAGVSTTNGRFAAYMPQGDTLLPWRTALGNATLGAVVGGADRRVTERRAGDLFARFGLAGFADAWPATLSGGMRQRVALLRTILTDRPVLLLDEPFASLDAITRTDLQGWLADLLRVETRTALLVTHDVDEAMRLADCILMLSPRPARIVDRITLPDTRPRSAIRVTEPDFATVKRHVLQVLAGR